MPVANLFHQRFVFAASAKISLFFVLFFSFSFRWHIPHICDCVVVCNAKAESNFKRNPLKPTCLHVCMTEIEGVCAGGPCTLTGVLSVYSNFLKFGLYGYQFI